MALDRPATLLEGKLLYREQRCGVCWDREFDGVKAREGKGKDAEWRTCEGCRVQGWCCSEHAKLGFKEHKETRDREGRNQVR